jgi:long-chain acyl-CoA synthetase
MTEALGLWRIAAEEPERLAVADPDGREVTYGELAALSNRYANGLRGLGLQAGGGIAVALPNSIEFLALYAAAMQTGLYFTPINWHLVGPEIAYIVNDSEASVFIAHERFADVAQAAAKEIEMPADRFFGFGEIPGFRSIDELLAGQPDTPPSDRTSGAPMQYTSGTTGRPKGVRRQLSGMDPDEAAGLSGLFFSLFGIKAHDDNVHICGSPLYHTAPLVFGATSISLGHPVVLMEKWDPEEMLRLIERYRVTHSHMVPTQFHRLLALPDEVKSKYDLSSLRTMIHAAAPCPVEIKQRMLEWWGPVIVEYYAATEGGGTLVMPEQWLQKPGTVGTPWPTSQIKIFDDDGKELPPNEPGTVYMQMGGAKFEYFKDEEKTRKARREDFFTVGDIGYLDDDGYLFLCDRKSDMIISGGVNIYPAEIEGVFLTHPKVGDVAVFGIPHPDWGEEIKAVIEPGAGIEASDELTEELFAFARERLAKFKLPKSIDYTDEMPRDPNGKLYKRKLRDPHWEGRERAI